LSNDAVSRLVTCLVILSCLMFLSPQFLSVRMIIRREFQKSYKRIENIFYLTKNPVSNE
jgi:hypothetical protein